MEFAKTHHSIVSLSDTITILWHICQNTPPIQKIESFALFAKLSDFGQVVCFGKYAAKL
jgi:hypothetical protein